RGRRRRSSAPARRRGAVRARSLRAAFGAQLLRDVDHVAHHRIDMLLPAAAAEDAVMPYAGLDVVVAQVGAERAAEVLRGERLAHRADVVALALHREQGGAADRTRVDEAAVHPEAPARKLVLLEDAAHRLEV